MAVDVSKNIFDLFSGSKRTRLVPTLAIAVIVTAAVVVPLVWRAIDARENPPERIVVLAPAAADAVLVDTGRTDPEPLDGARVSGPILVSVERDGALAASFRLFAAGSDAPILESQDVDGPSFDMVVSPTGGSPFDTSLLTNGDYELFVTIRMPSEDQRVAVGFEVDNP